MGRLTIRKATICLVILAFAAQLAGCGTLLYPERRGQVAGKYDTDIILLDAAGLIVGIIPGVIAFAVDLSTGAIYLPKGQKSRTREILGSVEIERVPLEGRTFEEMEAALLEHSGVRADLRSPTVRFTRSVNTDLEARLQALNRPWFARSVGAPGRS